MNNKGKIVQVMGPVVDVEFENQDLPYIKDALTVELNGKKLVMEVGPAYWEIILYAVSCWPPVTVVQGHGGNCHRSRYFRSGRKGNSGTSFQRSGSDH